MASIFENPPQESRIFSAPAVASQPWAKIAAAFLAGTACAVLAINFPTGSSTESPELARQADLQAAQSAKVSSSAESAAPAKALPPVEPAPPPASATGAALQDASKLAEAAPPSPDAADAPEVAAATADGLACEQQTWPYVDRMCGGSGANSGQTMRSVRVIPADRSAPSTLTTAVPSPSPAGRTTDGLSRGQASATPQEAPAPQVGAVAAIDSSAQGNVPMPLPQTWDAGAGCARAGNDKQPSAGNGRPNRAGRFSTVRAGAALGPRL